MNGSATRLRLQVAPERSALEPTRLTVLAFLAPHALSARAVYAIELVLEEVLSNQFKYAFAGVEGVAATAAEPVGLSVNVTANRIELLFEDRGMAFDPLQAPAPPSARSIAEARVGGLGLNLVRQFTHLAHYERRDGVNRLTLVILR